jgi:predicted acetyltransferase
LIIRLAAQGEKASIKTALMRYLKELGEYEEGRGDEVQDYRYFDLYWTDSDRYPIVMMEGDDLIGFCLLRDTGDSFSVAEFSVAPEFRRRGYGRQLVKFVVGFCREKKRHKLLFANSLVNNEAARRFWAENCFKTTKIVEEDGRAFYQNVRRI